MQSVDHISNVSPIKAGSGNKMEIKPSEQHSDEPGQGDDQGLQSFYQGPSQKQELKQGSGPVPINVPKDNLGEERLGSEDRKKVQAEPDSPGKKGVKWDPLQEDKPKAKAKPKGMKSGGLGLSIPDASKNDPTVINIRTPTSSKNRIKASSHVGGDFEAHQKRSSIEKNCPEEIKRNSPEIEDFEDLDRQISKGTFQTIKTVGDFGGNSFQKKGNSKSPRKRAKKQPTFKEGFDEGEE